MSGSNTTNGATNNAPADATNTGASGDPFPPESWLGYGLNMTQVVPIDITLTTKAIKAAHRCLSLGSKSSQQTNQGVTWTVPSNVQIAGDAATSTSLQTAYDNGTEAASDISTNAEVSGNYMAVSGSAGLNYSVESTFNENNSYYLYNFSQELLQVHLDSWADHVVDKALEKETRFLKSFDPTDPACVAAYRDLFNLLGSHIITGATYGAKLSIIAWDRITKTSDKSAWKGDVTAAFSGVSGSGKASADVTSSDSYKTTSQNMGFTVTCSGGDATLADKLSNDPRDANAATLRDQWMATVSQNPDIISLEVQTLAEVMRESDSDKVATLAYEVERAFNWICANPQKHLTKCSFVVSSDWGQIALLDPSAFILQDPASPPTAGLQVTFTPTKVMIGIKNSHNIQQDATVELIIQNDGSPIDFELSHGSDGETGGGGTCTLMMQGQPYTATGVTTNKWNTIRYYQVPVNPAPAAE